jgi:glycosyltransferase involved in cell wall biosynthesis
MSDYVRAGRARLLVQASLSAPHYNPHSAQALERLKQFEPDHVELLGVETPLSPDSYYELVSRADIVLLPYDRQRYRAASSGTLAEALAGGRPTIVPAGGWMAEQLPPGAGETFDDFESFVAAVKRVIDRYPQYAACARAHSGRWRQRHRPDALISAVCGERVEMTRIRRAA